MAGDIPDYEEAHLIWRYKMSLVPLHVIRELAHPCPQTWHQARILVVSLVWILHDYCRPSKISLQLSDTWFDFTIGPSSVITLADEVCSTIHWYDMIESSAVSLGMTDSLYLGQWTQSLIAKFEAFYINHSYLYSRTIDLPFTSSCSYGYLSLSLISIGMIGKI